MFSRTYSVIKEQQNFLNKNYSWLTILYKAWTDLLIQLMSVKFMVCICESTDQSVEWLANFSLLFQSTAVKSLSVMFGKSILET